MIVERIYFGRQFAVDRAKWFARLFFMRDRHRSIVAAEIWHRLSSRRDGICPTCGRLPSTCGGTWVDVPRGMKWVCLGETKPAIH